MQKDAKNLRNILKHAKKCHQKVKNHGITHFLDVSYTMHRAKVLATYWAHMGLDMVELVLLASSQKVQASVEVEYGLSRNRLVRTYHSKGLSSPSDYIVLFNRPGVAGAVLQSPPSVIN